MSTPSEGSQPPLTDAQRIENLKKAAWIGYEPAVKIRASIEDLLTWPGGPRMPGYAIIAESFNGKTSLLSSVARRVNPPPPQGDTGPQAPVPPTRPFFLFQSPPEPDESRLYDEILRGLSMLGSPRESPASKVNRIKVIFRNLEVKLIGIDEFGFQQAGSPNKQRKSLNALKYIGNEIGRPIVLAAVPETLNLLQSDKQIANRYEPLHLPKWKSTSPELPKLLASFEKVLDLKKPSGLHNEAIAARIVAEGDGVLGHMDTLLRKLAKQAIETKTEKITASSLTAKNLASIGWVHPSKRHQHPT